MQFLRFSLFFLLICAVVLPPPALADGPGGGHPWTLSLRSDAGDVLRPKRASGDYSWFIGIDGGLTYSSFSNGPLAYYTPNPHNPRYVLPASVNDGSGLGFYLGATLDFPLSDIFGIVLKANYHTRMGAFDETTDMMEIHPQTETNLTTIINNKTDWTFDYIGIDLLGRINLGSSPVYLLLGPSFGLLQSNTAKLDQTLVQPEDIYYTEDVQGLDEVVNELRTASMEAEVSGFKSSRIDVKFGVGMWIELNPNLYLTPELTVAYPLGTFVESANTELSHIPTETAEIIPVWSNGEGLALARSNKDFNMLTAFFTIGLRWRMN
ncbi:MAG: PorT family protein [Bacteroidia bacterium]|nr:PorT family protein [Bacteroidia bacterium]